MLACGEGGSCFPYWEGGDTCPGGGFHVFMGDGGGTFMSIYGYGWSGVRKGAEVEVFEGTKTMSIHVSRIHVLRMVECL
jgi:hypothetical protein